MTTFFSVIIPVYNVVSYVEVCLASLLESAKRLDDSVTIEIICINDGSTDGSGGTLDKFLTNYKKAYNISNVKLIIIHKSNTGVGPTRNVGLRKASGAWILFVDPDDIVSMDYFVEIYKNIRKYNPSILNFAHKKIYKQEYWDTSKSSRNVKVEENETVIFRVLYSAVLWNMCYQREVVEGAFFQDIVPSEDVLFNASILGNIKNVVIMDSPLYGYFQRENSLMHKKEVTLTQMRSARISCTGRIRYAMSWKGYSCDIKKELYKMVRTTFLYQNALWVLTAKKNKDAIWDEYCMAGQMIYTKDADYIPFLRRNIGRLIFKYKLYWAWFMFLYAPIRIRVLLLKFKVVNTIKKRLRNFK